MGNEEAKRVNRNWRALLSVFVLLCLVFSLQIQAFAASGMPGAVSSAGSSVLQVVVSYQEDDGTAVPLQTGSGFLVNSSTLVTCSHVTDITESAKEIIAANLNVDKNTIEDHVKITVMDGSSSVGASIISGSKDKDLDFEALKLSRALSSRRTLKLRASSELSQDEKCYAIGYPGKNAVSSTGIVRNYVITTGIATRLVYFIENPHNLYVINTASVSGGDSGGALVDQYGNAIGVIKAIMLDGTYCAVSTDNAIDTLRAAGISCRTASVGKITSGGITYRVTDADAKTAAAAASSKNIRKAVIKSTVKINGKYYKVTSVSKNAFKNRKKLISLSIGKNVSTVGSKAFYGCSGLRKITVKGTALSSLGSGAIRGIYKKARISVPKSSLKAYRQLFTAASGFRKTMKLSAVR